MSLITKIHNKFVYLAMSLVLIGSLFTNITGAYAQETKKYSGKEMFGAIALGQGELAKEFPKVWSDEMYEIVNNEENSSRAESILNKISEDNPKFFIELEEAVYSTDFVKVDQVLENGGDVLNEAMNVNASEDLKLNDGTATGACAVFVGVYIALVAYADVLAWTRELAWTSDDKLTKNSGLEQKEIVYNLITAVN